MAMFWSVRRTAQFENPALPVTLETLACATDHLVWSVADLDQAIEQFVGRMGFPLLYGPSGDAATMRVADVGLGTGWVRFVERSDWKISQPISLAFRTTLPLEEAELLARQRGLESGGVFVAAGRGESGRLPLISFILLRGIIARSGPGILLVRYFGQDQAQRVSDCVRFLDSPAGAHGLIGMSSIRAEIAQENGADRWSRLLGRNPVGRDPESRGDLWELVEGGSIEAVPGASDRISSIVLQASNTLLLRNAWRKAGVKSELRGGTLLVDPSSAAGVPLQIRSAV